MSDFYRHVPSLLQLGPWALESDLLWIDDETGRAVLQALVTTDPNALFQARRQSCQVQGSVQIGIDSVSGQPRPFQSNMN